VVHEADRITVVSEPMREALLSRYPTLSARRVVYLPNGYDPADFAGVVLERKDPARLTIVYTGSFYGQRTAKPFLNALRRVLADGRIPREAIRVQLVGNIGRATKREIETLGLGDVVECTGYVPHRQSIAYLLSADALLLVIGSGPGTQAVLTGKVFEYLAAGKPILVLAQQAAAADLVCEARAGAIADPEDEEVLATQIQALYGRWRRGDLACSPDPTVLARYDRRRLTRELAGLLDEMVSERRWPESGSQVDP